MGEADRELLKEKLKRLTRDGKIPCAVALKTANEANVAPKVIGDLCNELKIKIAGCQLGCFP